MLRRLIFSILVILCLFILYSIIFNTDNIYISQDYDIDRDGFIVYKNVLNPNEIDVLKQYSDENKYKEMKEYLLHESNLTQWIKTKLSDDYVFQDYIWIIKKSTVHTCHRDNNGDFFNEGQQHPSYTLLLYLEDMEKCLGVIPESHKDKNSYFFNFSDSVMNLLCNKGDAILFNANLIHVGTINEKDDNLRIQLKVTHKDDLSRIQYYQNFNKILNKENILPRYLRKAQKNLSCMFPGISNLTQSENIRTSRGSDNGVDIGIQQQLFSYLFYGNPEFYNLPNAFE